MPHKLYVYLRGGRGDAYVTDNWNGVQPGDHDGEEESEPYRDMSQTVMKVTSQPHAAGSGIFSAEGSVVYPGTVTALTTSAYRNIDSGILVTPKVEVEGTPNDEAAGTDPQQFTKHVTWLCFEEAGDDGCVFRFRKADVIGWGKNPRL